MSDDASIRVALGERAYDIHIGCGLLEKAGALLRPQMNRPHAVVVTDEHVAAAQWDRLQSGLRKADINTDAIVLPPGEATKSFGQLDALCQALLDRGVERNDMIIAFGGGVVGDLVGFAASILRRGCRFAQIPTTLLAQVDSSVGGKTAINTPQGKNLIGAFHQPSIVIADIDTLDTLPRRELRAGYAEVVKYGVIADAPFFSWLEKNGAALLDGDKAARIRAVRTSCEAKARIVATDETERGERALLNLGHTFGHAFEAAYGYNDDVLHGEAVALGMVLAMQYAASLGMAQAFEAERLANHLAAIGLPTRPSDLPANPHATAAQLRASMMQDKKVEDGALTLILAEGIGAARIVKDADAERVERFLEERVRGSSPAQQPK